MDTLAEAYYVNGYFKEAIFAEQRALSLTNIDRNYYIRQIEKFKSAEKEHDDRMRW